MLRMKHNLCVSVSLGFDFFVYVIHSSDEMDEGYESSPKEIDTWQVVMYNIPSRELPSGRCKRWFAHTNQKSVSAQRNTVSASVCAPEADVACWHAVVQKAALG